MWSINWGWIIVDWNLFTNHFGKTFNKSVSQFLEWSFSYDYHGNERKNQYSFYSRNDFEGHRNDNVGSNYYGSYNKKEKMFIIILKLKIFIN